MGFKRSFPLPASPVGRSGPQPSGEKRWSATKSRLEYVQITENQKTLL